MSKTSAPATAQVASSAVHAIGLRVAVRQVGAAAASRHVAEEQFLVSLEMGVPRALAAELFSTLRQAQVDHHKACRRALAVATDARAANPIPEACTPIVARARPVQAIQFIPESPEVAHACERFVGGVIGVDGLGDTVITAHDRSRGALLLLPGHWLIKAADGACFTCTPEHFAATYLASSAPGLPSSA